MTERSWPVQLLHAIRRDRWIVVGCLVVAVAVAVGLNLGEKTTYQGQATITANSTTLAGNARMAAPDTVAAESKTSEFHEELARVTGMDVEQVKTEFNAYAAGTPLNKIYVQFTDEDKKIAMDSADAAATLLLAKAYELLEPELARQRALVQEGKDAIEVIDTAEDPSLVAGDRWSISRNLIIEEGNLALYEEAYVYNGSPSAKASSRRDKLKNAAYAGVLLGLAAGVLIAGVRDYMLRRAGSA